LFASWCGYAEQQHEAPGNMKTFTDALGKRAIRLEDKKLKGNRGFFGLRLLDSAFSRSP
jgi:hypothetical protein